MNALKNEYGETLNWLVVFPGDFHLLRNYKEVLMTTYWDAGLEQVAAASEYRGEMLTSISKCCCSSFSHTTNFFFETWEARYQHVYNQYICECDESSCSTNFRTSLSKGSFEYGI